MVINKQKKYFAFVQLNEKTIFCKKTNVNRIFLLTFDGMMLYNDNAYRSITN